MNQQKENSLHQNQTNPITNGGYYLRTHNSEKRGISIFSMMNDHNKIGDEIKKAETPIRSEGQKRTSEYKRSLDNMSSISTATPIQKSRQSLTAKNGPKESFTAVQENLEQPKRVRSELMQSNAKYIPLSIKLQSSPLKLRINIHKNEKEKQIRIQQKPIMSSDTCIFLFDSLYLFPSDYF